MASRNGYYLLKDFIFKGIYRSPVTKTSQVVKDSQTPFSDWMSLLKGKNVSNHEPCFSATKFIHTSFYKLNETLNIIALLFAKQCNAIAAQRVRRAIQMMQLYNRLGYDKQTLQKVLERLGKNLKHGKDQPLYLLFGACLFSWDQNNIKEDETRQGIEEIQNLKDNNPAFLPHDSDWIGDEWEKVIDRDNLVVWRKPVPNSYLYQYKVFGTFLDIPARAFYDVQVDLDYRKQWDKLIINLDVVDRDEKSNSEVIRWITHYPFPMYSREYVFVRKCRIDVENNVLLTMCKSVEHPNCPVESKYVRVTPYESNMVIRPHNKIDENGFDYILTYCDNPQAAIPTPAYNWMASTGVPDFVEKVHKAAVNLQELKSSQQNSEDDERIIAM